jgi:hypothetical protein
LTAGTECIVSSDDRLHFRVLGQRRNKEDGGGSLTYIAGLWFSFRNVLLEAYYGEWYIDVLPSFKFVKAFELLPWFVRDLLLPSRCFYLVKLHIPSRTLSPDRDYSFSTDPIEKLHL